MIDECEYDCFRCCGKRLSTYCDRGGHLGIGVGVDCYLDTAKKDTDFIRAMAQHDNDLIDSAVAKVIDAGFNDSLVSEGKQRLEGAHAAGLTGGQQNCCNISHV